MRQAFPLARAYTSRASCRALATARSRASVSGFVAAPGRSLLGEQAVDGDNPRCRTASASLASAMRYSDCALEGRRAKRGRLRFGLGLVRARQRGPAHFAGRLLEQGVDCDDGNEPARTDFERRKLLSLD